MWQRAVWRDVVEDVGTEQKAKLSIILICSVTVIHTGAGRVTHMEDKCPTFIFWCWRRRFKEEMHHYSALSPIGFRLNFEEL